MTMRRVLLATFVVVVAALALTPPEAGARTTGAETYAVPTTAATPVADSASWPQGRPIRPQSSGSRDLAHVYQANLSRAPARPDGYRLAPQTARNYSNYGGEFLDDAIRSPVVRPDLGNLSPKIQLQMGSRGWTPDLIDEAVLQGRGYSAVNKLGGANTPATRYVHPRTGQSVVIDNASGEVIQSAVRGSDTDGWEHRPSQRGPAIGARCWRRVLLAGVRNSGRASGLRGTRQGRPGSGAVALRSGARANRHRMDWVRRSRWNVA
jgi:hypothetical protein